MPSYDVLDEHAGIAQQIDQMIAASERTHRQQVIEKLSETGPMPQKPSQNAASWFNPGSMPTSGASVAPMAPQVVPAMPTLDEETLLADLEARDKIAQKYSNKHLHTIQPIGVTPAVPVAQDDAVTNSPMQDDTSQVKTEVTSHTDPAILNLARNDDLSVDTLARQAKKKPANDEVVISLH